MKSLSALLLASIAFMQIPAAQAFHYKVLYSFQGGSDGANPAAELMLPPGSRNVLLGTTVFGGTNSGGTVYSINRISGKETLEAPFNCSCDQPKASLTYAPYYGLYGTTETGGQEYDGIIYSLSDLAPPYIHEFHGNPDGAEPFGTMVLLGGTLYGTTAFGGSYSDGSVFYYNPATQTEGIVYSFCVNTKCTDGYIPEAGLTIYNSILYGTTTAGGETNQGNVFSLSPATGQENNLHSFNGSGDGSVPTGTLLNVNGALYGTTQFEGKYGSATSGGTIFATDPTNGTTNVYYDFCMQTNCADGSVPYAGLIRDKSTLYGTTEYGGSNIDGGTNGGGTVFSLDLSSGTEAVLYNFCSQTNCTDGANPMAKLLMVGGKLYGTTWAGGTGSCTNKAGYANGCGTVFEITR